MRTPLLFLAAGCAGCFRDGPDPGYAPNEPRSVWSVHAAVGTQQSVRSFVVDADGVYFVYEDGMGVDSIIAAAKDGSGASTVTTNLIAGTRIAVSGPNIFYVANAGQFEVNAPCPVYMIPKAGGAPTQLATIPNQPGCLPIGIVADDSGVYVSSVYDADNVSVLCANASASSCQYGAHASIFRVDPHRGGETLVRGASGLLVACDLAKTCLWRSGSDLYWFEAVSDAYQNWKGGTLVKASETAGAPSIVARLPLENRPTSFSTNSSSLVWATTSRSAQGGCSITRAPLDGSAPSVVWNDPDRACRDVSVDETDAYFAIVDVSSALEEGLALGKVPLTASSSATILPLSRPDIDDHYGPTDLDVDTSNVYAIDNLAVLAVSKTLFP